MYIHRYTDTWRLQVLRPSHESNDYDQDKIERRKNCVQPA